MSDKIQYLDYSICLSDEAAVAALQAGLPFIHVNRNDPTPIDPSRGGNWLQNGSIINSTLGTGWANGDVYGAPALAALKWNAPIAYQSTQFVAPCISSGYLVKAGQTTNDPNLDDWSQHSGGFLGFFGTTTKYIWRGRFVYLPTPSVGGGVDGIMARSWIDGFENPVKGDGSQAGVTNYTRASSRHADGLGMAIRGAKIVGQVQHLTTENGGSAPISSWERLYFKLLENPTATEEFWRAVGTEDTRMGALLKVDTAGRIVLYDCVTSGHVQMGTTNPLTLGAWYCLDIFFSFGASAFVDLVLNQVTALSVTGFNSSGLARATTHAYSSTGGFDGGNTSLCMDFDDWHRADLPPNRTGNDVINGSKIVRIAATGVAADNGTYAGDWRSLLQLPAAQYTTSLTSSTSADRLSVTTDCGLSADAAPALGVVAFTVSALSFRGGSSGAAKSSLGYALGTAAAVMTVLTDESITTAAWNHVLVSLGAIVEPLSPLTFIFDHAASTDLSTVVALTGDAQLIGVFGPEDLGAKTDVKGPAGDTGLHNAPYPRTVWARKGSPPESPVAVYAGTYAGNSGGQDLTFQTPIHWLFVRDAAANTWNLWYSTMLASNFDGYRNLDPSQVAQACIDPAFVPGIGGTMDQAQQTTVRIVGANTRYNLTGHTYQYVAFSDPGMRFMLNGCLSQWYNTVSKTQALLNTNFLPAASFFWFENAQAASNGVLFKGPGHTSDDASPLDGAATSTTATISRGSIVSKSGLTNIAQFKQIAFNLWRQDDGSGDPGVNNVVQAWTYTGNGGGARVLAFPKTSTGRPLFAIVTPHNGASEFRDPSHSAASTTVPTTGAARITGGGVSEIHVSSGLNTNAIVYDVFVIIGGATAGNDGWSGNGTFIPVNPGPPVDGPWDTTPTGDVTTIVITPGDTGGNPLGAPGNEFGAQCIAASTKVINTALLRLGITKGVVDIVNDATPEAESARQVYVDQVEACLREYAWPFATRYLAVTLLAGTETEKANLDWQYAYQLPSDYVAARRIVNPLLGRSYDPDPPKFKIGSDTDGLLTTDQVTVDGAFANNAGAILFTDQEDAVLEYTYRPGCAAGAGDALFRSALAWRIASELAPAIAKNKVTALDAWKMYLGTLATASTTSANEQQDTNGEGPAGWTSGRD